MVCIENTALNLTQYLPAAEFTDTSACAILKRCVRLPYSNTYRQCDWLGAAKKEQWMCERKGGLGNSSVDGEMGYWINRRIYGRMSSSKDKFFIDVFQLHMFIQLHNVRNIYLLSIFDL
jgi:hypothetical protein